MFYIWHTLLIVAFIAMAFFMGLILGKKMDSKTRNLSLLNKKLFICDNSLFFWNFICSEVLNLK
jgi:hypothetical protein